ncbi:MAG TPA: efflux RND transporter permease subunit [Bacteroidetes bacterium]|nr:efflux RND transporter permease subunit [Bacteroidota bacterium]
MVRFLIHRPVAVVMTYVALLLMGLAALTRLPVALMPDIDIPGITVRVEWRNTSCGELENTVVTPIRRQLLQVSGLEDITGETRNGSALLRLRFKYGTPVDMAFIEVNEKIDRVMAGLPRDMERPQVIRASVTDVPVFYLNLYRDDLQAGEGFLEMSEFAGEVIRKRIEQLPQVALVDVTGFSFPELVITPNEQKLYSLGMGHEEIRQALVRSNLSMGNMTVREGPYRFVIRFSSVLRSVEDVKNIYIGAGSRIMKLGELAEIRLAERERKGMFFTGDHPAVSLAIIQQADARMAGLKKEMMQLMKSFSEDYPGLRMELVRDQSSFLEYSIRNLRSSLLIGALLAFAIMFLFLHDRRSPWLAGISIPVSVVISFLFFHLAGLSINLISLSGLVLGVGMIIDNSIIVIDNIRQHLARGSDPEEACVRGTNEVIRPLISSVLTTCAVFVPLVFLSGMAGALFRDQAIAVSIGLGLSLLVSITLLPVLFYALRKKGSPGQVRYETTLAEKKYEKGLAAVFRNRAAWLVVFVLLIPLAVVLFRILPMETMPVLSRDDVMVKIDWNENISLDENRIRTQRLLGDMDEPLLVSNIWIGEQQYMLEKDEEESPATVKLYLRGSDSGTPRRLRSEISAWLRRNYRVARVSFAPPPTVFEQLFGGDNIPVEARISVKEGETVPPVEVMRALVDSLGKRLPGMRFRPLPVQEYTLLRIDSERLLLYGVSQDELVNRLRSLFRGREVETLRTGSRLIPVVIHERRQPVGEVLQQSLIRAESGTMIPLQALVSPEKQAGYRIRFAGQHGNYVPLIPAEEPVGVDETVKVIREVVAGQPGLRVEFTGDYFRARGLFSEMVWVLLISLLLLYFILAAQFESLTQPLIVMLEIPLDLAGCLFVLWVFGGGINIMSMIGVVVMAGIIINDSILKVDTINHLRTEGLPLEKAIREGGLRRFKPILMTTLTTVLALLPLLFGHALGSELQRPLALAVIGGLVLGTAVSLYFIPLAYAWLYRHKK